jgi:hypothetical protein
MLRRRTFLYVALALAVPLPAFALTGGDAPAGLSVSASLDECGIAASNVVCKIDASWNEVAGADRYTASVSSPDGAVSDYGDVGGTSTSIWVPYVGNGTYTVTVSAWGTPPGADKPVVVAKQRATTSDTSGRAKPDAPQTFTNRTGTSDPADGQGAGAGAVPSDPSSDPPPTCDRAAPQPPAPESDPATPPAADGTPPATADGCPEPPPPPPDTTTTTTTTTTPEGG